MTRPAGALSLDLDNKWSYLKTRGVEHWRDYPSYLQDVIPLVNAFLDARGLRITVFVVGRDAEFPENHALLASLVEGGHEIGNHSLKHEPWLHLYSEEQAREEVDRSTDAIATATGVVPVGFRGPGYSVSQTVLEALGARGYLYDATSLPTWIGPLARAYYFRTSRLSTAERSQRQGLFGRWRDGLRTNRPHPLSVDSARMLEIPVTTMPLIKVPIHFSYLHQLAGASERMAQAYLRAALNLCRLVGLGPSILLHPLDFLGRGESCGLEFFPAMNQDGARKRRRLSLYLDIIEEHFDLMTLEGFADVLAARQGARQERT